MASKYREGQLGLFRPESSWERPTELPDLRGRAEIAIDTENHDIGLETGRGPGWPLGPLGKILGVSWAAEGSVGYAPVAHPETDNFPLENVIRWLNDHFAVVPRVVFHNAPYDIGWLGSYGVRTPLQVEDTMAACVMVDENYRAYNLDACCARAGVAGKDTQLLRDAVEAYGGNPKRPQAHIWRLPARLAAPYAEQDAKATLDLWHQTEPQLRAQDLWDAYRTEMELVPMVVAMRRRGIRIDVSEAERTAAQFRTTSAEHLKEIGRLVGLRRPATMEEIRSPASLGAWLGDAGIRSPSKTDTGRDSFAKDWMEKYDHPLTKAIVDAKKFEEAATKFVDNYILGFAHRGRVHAEIHQFLSDDGSGGLGGTRSHRFSYSEPPLQQMSSPDKDPRDAQKNLIEDRAVGTKLRRLFLSEKGTFWGAADYSSQEPRLTVHYAALCKMTGADSAVEEYARNPRTDYHQFTADLTGLPRPRAKILNLAMVYGKGKKATAEELQLSLPEAESIIKTYHQRLPYIKPLEDYCKRMAAQRGYIRLIDGARMHYPNWDVGYIDNEERRAAVALGKRLDACSYEEARERQSDPDHPWKGKALRRADTRKALNNLIQGSAARQTKKAMLALWREGILPLIQLHDEVGYPADSEATTFRVERCMVEAIPLLVPTIVDNEIGPDWGRAKMSWADCAAKYGDMLHAA